MLKCKQMLQVRFFMMQDEVMGIMIHQSHQFFCLIDNNSPVAPGKYGSKETRYFYILFFTIGMRD